MPERETEIKVMLVVYYCESKKESLCYFKVAEVRVPIEVRTEAPALDVKASYTLKVG